MNHTHSFRNSGSRRPWFSDDFAVWGPVTQSTRRHRSECPSRPHPRPGLRAGSSALVLGTRPWWGAQGLPWGAGRAPRGQRGRVVCGRLAPGPRGRQVCRALLASTRRASCLPRGSRPRRRRTPRQCPRHCPRGARGPDAGRRARPAFPVAGSGPRGRPGSRRGGLGAPPRSPSHVAHAASRGGRRGGRVTAPRSWGKRFRAWPAGCPRPGLSSRAACFVIRHVVATGCARASPGGAGCMVPSRHPRWATCDAPSLGTQAGRSSSRRTTWTRRRR